MARKVGLSKITADEIVALQQQAEQRGLRSSFRRSWIAMWDALHQRPLPPDESATVFGEIRFRTKNPPRHAVCIGSVRPLAVQFAVSEETTNIAGEPVTAVTILKVLLM
jgi:hypothetical protein